MLASIVFLAASGFLIYVLFGYPLILAWLARQNRRPVTRTFVARPVTVLLAVHNGERWIRGKLESILALKYPGELLQVVVISDGSTDATDSIAGEFAGGTDGRPTVELLRVARGGKALALNAGMRIARGEILFFTDVRQNLDPESLSQLVACFADPAVGVVSGEMIITSGQGTTEEIHTGLYWRYEKFIRKQHSRLDSTLGATGCIYAMRADLAVPLPPGTLLDDMYLPLAAFFRGYRVILEESARAYDLPTSLDTEFRRKVRTLAGVYQVIGFYPALLGPSNRMLVHFLSHKLARLLLPFALLAIAIGSFGLPAPFAAVAIAGQACFYVLAALDPVIPEWFPAKRLSSLARTFVVLMAAALAATSILFRPSGTFWSSPTGHSSGPASGPAA